MPDALDQYLAERTGGESLKPGFIEGIGEDLSKSFNAAKMMLGLYEPLNAQERGELRRRFLADAALLGVSAITGGAAGAALKGAKPIARLILSGAISGGSGMAAYAGVEGEPVVPAAALGAVTGAIPLGAIGKVRAVGKAAAEKITAEAAAKTAATAAAKTAAAEKARNELGAIYGAVNQVDPFSLPRRTPVQQRILDPFSVPRTAEDILLDERTRAFSLPESRLEEIAAGVLQPEGRGTIRAGIAISRQGRDKLGRFTRKQITKSLQAEAPDLKSEANAALRESFIEFLGGERARAGEITPRQIQARLPRRGVQSRYLGPRHGMRGHRPTLAGELLAEGAAPEVVNHATRNEAIRRFLLKLPSGDLLEKAYAESVAFVNRSFIPITSVLNRMGGTAKMLSGLMNETTDRATMLAANDLEGLTILRKLSTVERRNVAHVLHGDDVPMNDKVVEVAATIRMLLDDIAANASDVGLRVYSPRTNTARAFVPRKNYFPLEYSEKTIRKYMLPGPEREAALKRIMASEQGINRAQAEAILNRYLRPEMSEFRYGHLQIQRELALPGWEEDPLKVLPQYFLRARKRIEIARTFGAADEAAHKMIRAISKEGRDAKFAADAYKSFADKQPKELTGLAKLARNINIMSLLTTAGIVQPAQLSNIAALTGYKNFMQGTAAFLSRNKVTQEWVARTGAYMQEIVQDVVPFAERSVTSGYLNLIGLLPLDKANRVIAALAGRFYADDLAVKLVSGVEGKQLQNIERKLLRIGLNPEEIRAAGGVLTSEQRSRAAQSVAHITQFRGSNIDLPFNKNTTAGQFLYLFRTYAIQQSRFVHSLVDNAFRHGDWGPMMRFMTLTGTWTPAVGAFVMGARYGNWTPFFGSEGGLSAGENRPDMEGIRNYIELAMYGGALGAAYDGFRAMYSGPQFMGSFLAGPTLTDVASFLGSDLPELKGNPRKMLHDALKHTPLFGRRVADWLVPLE